MQRLWSSTLFLIVLLAYAESGQCQETNNEANNEDAGCTLSRQEIRAIVNDARRTWTVTNDVLEDHNLQDIIKCTEEGDTISLQTRQTVQPPNRAMIPWDLTFDGGNRRATMTCPEGEGLFFIRSGGLTLRNLVIEGCNLTEADGVAGIIETDACANGTNNRVSLRLNWVDFTRNTNAGGSLISLSDPECYSVDMRHVVFQSNQYESSSELSSSNDFRDVELVRNQVTGVFSLHTSLFYFPPDSEATINNFFARNNSGTLLHLDRSTVAISHSSFVRNFAADRGLIFADASDVLLSSCVFDRNNDSYNIGCWGGSGRFDCGHGNIVFSKSKARVVSTTLLQNSAAVGGAVELISPGDTSFSRCLFASNSAFDSDLGGGAVSIFGNRSESGGDSVRFRNCRFRENFGGRNGGAILAGSFHGGEILIQDSTFLRNKAGSGGYGSGGAISIRDTEQLVLKVEASTFDGNRARDQGGALEIVGVSGEVALDNSVFQHSRSETGGALFVADSTELDLSVKNTNFRENKANFYGGGAVYATAVNGSIAIDGCTFSRNEAQGDGGGMYAIDIGGDIALDKCAFTRNEAQGDGGAIYGEELRRIRIAENCSFEKNRARFGGGRLCEIGPVNVRNDQNSSADGDTEAEDSTTRGRSGRRDGWNGVDTSTIQLAIDNCVARGVDSE